MSIKAAIQKVYQYAEPNISLVGWMGFIGFPVYYVIWKYLFPQPYENLTLRLACSLLFFVVIIRRKLKPQWRNRMHLYYLVVITLCLPFFFFYMLLMNNWSTVWLMSLMSAIFLHILLVHSTRVMFAQTVIGIVLAVACAWIAKGFRLDVTVDWAHVPIFLFIYIFGNAFYFRNQVEHETKVSIAKMFGAGVAHEMRNPLSGLYSSVGIIQSLIPNLKEEKKEIYQLSAEEVSLLQEVSDDAMKIIHDGNEAIDLLLASIDESRVSRATFRHHSAQKVVESAVESFSYRRSQDRLAISFDVCSDFEFLGNSTLLRYVMYNLLKNAFQHCTSEGFQIHVKLEAGEKVNRIVVTDNGPGIAPGDIGKIFKDFYTTGKSGNFGLGLPFCKRVMCSFGGDIQCTSVPGEWCRFTMTFPSIQSETVKDIRCELICQKSLLLVSDNDILIAVTKDRIRSLDLKLTLLDVATVLNKREHEFEYDLILIDLNSIGQEHNHLDFIESQLPMTESQIAYLSHKPVKKHKKTEFNPVWIKTETWLKNTDLVIESLLFDFHADVREPAQPKKIVQRSRSTIMIVDDSESLRKLTARLLETQGFDVIQHEDGKKAIEALDTDPVDLILMDIEMPEMNGIEASRYIRTSGKEFSTVPIIAHTGDVSPVTLDSIRSSGMSDYIVKPAEKSQLLEKISNWI
ncbi:hybrid sensor histidine kinase/response regulator [Photobacterium sp. SDRW27]|uniref:ATP-binding response regulator n=1 Tax=Photobacterium obscurum TaxID=2829490 RepID=UPI002243E7EA|nr:hybrid sensor histidine kinase/response regulator [Photobacterium obscurum]MCW8330209.1 hybrid sensor histidine kinase/response regulator [Photobacterium obscurum]